MASGRALTNVRCAIPHARKACPLTPSPVHTVFTLSIGGMVTMLNTSGQPIHPGDLIEWCLWNEKGTHNGKRQKQGPRRIAINIASVSSPKIIGRALSFAKAGESLDILLKQ